MATHMDVLNNWAKQTGKATKGFNIWYDGEAVFSYGRHFMIARHIRGLDGRPYVLFTQRTHSVSTAKHKSYAWRALDYGRTVDVIEVPDPATFNVMDSEGDTYLRQAASQARDALQAQLPAIARKYVKARTYKALYAEDYRKAVENIFKLCDAFGLARPILSTSEDMLPLMATGA